MRLRFESFGWAAFTTMLVAAISGGFVMCVFHFLVMKRLMEPVRNALAAEIADPDVRRNLVSLVPLGRKLWVAISGDVKAGDLVIVEGNERVRPGQEVRPQTKEIPRPE